MKKLLQKNFLILFIISNQSFAQEVVPAVQVGEIEEEQEVPFAAIEKFPQFQSCESSDIKKGKECFNQQISSHIVKNLVYPESAREANIQGRVTVMFVIDKEGNVINVRARGSVGGSELEEEAIRIVNLLPQFKPGIHRGKPVNVSFSLPIRFKLDEPVKAKK
jgi:protein TonB